MGLIALLQWADTTHVEKLDIFCDSALVVNQVNGKWKVNKPALSKLQVLATALLIRGKHTLWHIKGHAGNPGNEFVDRLCNEILDSEMAKDKSNGILGNAGEK
jgi:probable phosphoglycerate mutase